MLQSPFLVTLPGSWILQICRFVERGYLEPLLTWLVVFSSLFLLCAAQREGWSLLSQPCGVGRAALLPGPAKELPSHGRQQQPPCVPPRSAGWSLTPVLRPRALEGWAFRRLQHTPRFGPFPAFSEAPHPRILTSASIFRADLLVVLSDQS